MTCPTCGELCVSNFSDNYTTWGGCKNGHKWYLSGLNLDAHKTYSEPMTQKFKIYFFEHGGAYDADFYKREEVDAYVAKLRNELSKNPLIKMFLDQNFWHAHHVDIVIRFDGEDRRYEADWIKNIWYLVKDKSYSVDQWEDGYKTGYIEGVGDVKGQAEEMANYEKKLAEANERIAELENLTQIKEMEKIILENRELKRKAAAIDKLTRLIDHDDGLIGITFYSKKTNLHYLKRTVVADKLDEKWSGMFDSESPLDAIEQLKESE